MAATLTVEIVTPEAALWTGEASSLTTRSSEGELTILALHTPIVGDVVPGVVRVETSEGEEAFLVHGGFFQVSPAGEGATRATVLAGIAEPVGAIDMARAQAAKESAEAVLAQRSDEVDEETLAAARASLARAELRLSTQVKSQQ
jgi:F-type H+-transporting ATPase subunit epsilon